MILQPCFGPTPLSKSLLFFKRPHIKLLVIALLYENPVYMAPFTNANPIKSVIPRKKKCRIKWGSPPSPFQDHAVN